MTTSMFEQLGEWTANLEFEHLPARAHRSVIHAVTDLLGVAVAGADHDLVPLLLDYLGRSGSTGPCRLVGQGTTAGMEAAASFNAAVAHVLDFDDTSDTLLGHPTVVILPPLLAIADTRLVTGRDLMTAYAAGFEAAAHVANQMHPAHYERGWHPTATLGVFGTATAAAKLLGLDADGITRALAIASAAPSGLRAHFGTHMKSVQVGEAARKGITAAFLAAAGVQGNPTAFEDSQGYGVAYNGEDGFRREPFDSSPTRTWDLVDPGLALKQYPCCASAHPAVDAARALRSQVSDATIDGIRIRLHPRRLRHTDNPEPVTPLEGKFSVQYVVATALHTGSVVLGDFSPASLTRPEVRHLMDRTLAEPFPPEEYGPDHFAGEVRVELSGGRVVSKRVEKARGRGTELALTDDEVADKFRSCVAPTLGAGAEEVLSVITSLESVADVSQIMEALTA